MESVETSAELKNRFGELEAAIAERRLLQIKAQINELQAPDIAEFLDAQEDAGLQATLFRLLKKDLAVEVFEHLEFEEQDNLLHNLKQEKVIQILEDMDPDDRTELFEEMPAKIVKHYLRLLSREERTVATSLLGYPDDSVGRLMTTDYVAFRPDISVSDAIDKLREVALDKETIYHCYVINEKRKLIGMVSLKMLLISDPEDLLESILKEAVSVNANEDQEAAARLHKHYDLMALPVVDNEDLLVGLVTFDDLVDVIEEENTEDIQRMAAIVPEEHPYFDTGFFTLASKRILWLSILLFAQMFSAIILDGYHHSLKEVIALAFFIPLLMSTAGNTGAQSSTIIIRGLAIGEIRVGQFAQIVFREMRMGLVLGVVLCVLGYAAAYWLRQDASIALVLGLSVTFTVMAATVIGASLPIFFKVLKLDPALMSGPFITTMVDILGLIIYFEIAKRLLNMG